MVRSLLDRSELPIMVVPTLWSCKKHSHDKSVRGCTKVALVCRVSAAWSELVVVTFPSRSCQRKSERFDSGGVMMSSRMAKYDVSGLNVING